MRYGSNWSFRAVSWFDRWPLPSTRLCSGSSSSETNGMNTSGVTAVP